MKKKELFIVISSIVNNDTILAVKTALISAGHKGELTVIDQCGSKDYPRYNTGNRRVLISEHICAQPVNIIGNEAAAVENKWTFRPPVMITAPTYDDFINIAVVGTANSGKTAVMSIINNQLETLGIPKEQIQISCLDGVEHHTKMSEFITDYAKDILQDMSIKILIREFPISGEFPTLDAMIKGLPVDSQFIKPWKDEVYLGEDLQAAVGADKEFPLQVMDDLAKKMGFSRAEELVTAMEEKSGRVEGSLYDRFFAARRFYKNFVR